MSVIRVNKTKDYTVMSNHHLRDRNLSLKAKGLLSVMLSLPESWDYSIAGLVAICKENETAVKSALNELKQHKYLRITKLMPDKTQSHKIEYIYDVYEKPFQTDVYQSIENQEVENQPLENQPLENQPQLNTNESNTYISNTYVLSTDKRTDPAPVFDDAELQKAFNEWLQYKRERRESYKPTGLRALITTLKNEVKQRGKQAVIDGIYNSMRNGWRGIYYSGTSSKPQQARPIERDPDLDAIF